MVLLETFRLRLFPVVREGIWLGWILSYSRSAGMTTAFDTLPRPLAQETDDLERIRKIADRVVRFLPYAACVLNFKSSKRSPLFQILSTIAAIFRATVNRAISGRIPFSTSPS